MQSAIWEKCNDGDTVSEACSPPYGKSATMATLAEGITVLYKLGFYQTVFPFLLILALMYGLLSKTKPFGDSKAINIIISFIVAMFFTALVRSSLFLANLLPIFTAFLVILLLVMLIFMFIGVPAENITEAIKQPAGYVTLIALFVILIFVVLSQTFPEQALIGQPELAEQYNITEPTEGREGLVYFLSQQATAIILSPPILGLIILLTLFAIASYFITREK